MRWPAPMPGFHVYEALVARPEPPSSSAAVNVTDCPTYNDVGQVPVITGGVASTRNETSFDVLWPTRSVTVTRCVPDALYVTGPLGFVDRPEPPSRASTSIVTLSLN